MGCYVTEYHSVTLELISYVRRMQEMIYQILKKVDFKQRASQPSLSVLFFPDSAATPGGEFEQIFQGRFFWSQPGVYAKRKGRPRDCRRLIKNAAVCWNYLYLSQELATEKNEKRRAELIEAIRNGSVATWKHFNLHGEFDFSDERMVDSMGLDVPKNPDWKSD